MRTPKIHGLLIFVLMTLSLTLSAQEKSLHQLQLKFVDLRLGMFVHFGLPTFQEADWTDPDLEPGVLTRPNWTRGSGWKRRRAPGANSSV